MRRLTLVVALLAGRVAGAGPGVTTLVIDVTPSAGPLPTPQIVYVTPN